jgi:hypothetical protein
VALSLHASTDEVIDLAEFRRRVLAKVDPADPATLLRAGTDIVALANNRNLLVDQIRHDLANWRSGELRMYTPQSYLLDSFGKFTVRINLWKAAGMSAAELDFYSYASYHNHDFPFLTTQYYGPGYRTSIYEADADWRHAMPGDRLPMRFLEETDLPAGKVMYYRKHLDVHSQIPPPADSASLNLMLDDEQDLDRNQFYFDVASGRIIGRVENTVAKRLALLDFGHGLADQRSLPVLQRIARDTACEATRRKARELIDALGARRD